MIKRNLNIIKLVVALCIAILLLTLTLFTKPEQVQPAAVQAGQGVSLRVPAFLKSVRAQDAAQFDFSFILDEAGITAYTKLDQEIDLVKMQSRFKNIRQQTDQFISGIVIAPGYEKLPEFEERADIQVFLHREGWVVGYLTRWQTAAELFDWVHYDEKRLTTTLIESVVRSFALSMGISDFNVAYYDFRYPDATDLLLAADRVDGSSPIDSFKINIPRELTVYESTWSAAAIDEVNSNRSINCKLNGGYSVSLGVLLGYQSLGRWGTAIGEIISTEFPTGKTHEIFAILGSSGSDVATLGYCGVAVVYQ